MPTSDTLPARIAGKLLAAKRVLILTHQRPDGDALGSTFGMRDFLRANGGQAEILLPTGMPDRFRRLCRGALDSLTAQEAAGFDIFLSLDCANVPRLGTVDALPWETLKERDFICVDHHRGNSLEAPLQWVVPEACSTCELVTEILLASGKDFDGACAGKILMGMMTDTGCFCFSNTSAAAFRKAAVLMEHGANVDEIVNDIFFSKPLKQLRFESEFIETCLKTAAHGRIAYAFIPDELMKKHDFDIREDEGLIDILRQLQGVVIAVLIHHRADGFRISMRSKDPRFPVGPLARALGGGGHEMAAGTTLDLPDIGCVERRLLPQLEALFEKIIS